MIVCEDARKLNPDFRPDRLCRRPDGNALRLRRTERNRQTHRQPDARVDVRLRLNAIDSLRVHVTD